MSLRRLLFLLLIAACTASPTSTVDVPNAITLGLPVTEIRIGDEIQLTADVRNGLNASLPDAALEWSTDAPAVATISSSGRLLGVTAGTVQVTVRSGGVSDRRSVFVRPVAPFSIAIGTPPETIRVGNRVKLVADVRAEGGYQLINASVSWSVDDPAIATVDVFGDLVGVSPGTVTVTAVSGPASASSSVVILPGIAAQVVITGNLQPLTVGDQRIFTATVRTASGALLPQASLTWSSLNLGAATVSSDGVVTAIGAGQATIHVSTGTASSSVTVTVIPNPISPIEITGRLTPLVVGDHTQLAATVRTPSGVLLPQAPVSWSSTDPGVATVSSTGLVTGVSVGQATIFASSGAALNSVTVTIVSGFSPAHQLAFVRTLATGVPQIEVIAEDGTKLVSILPTIPLARPVLAAGPTATLTPDGASVVFDCNGGVCWLDLQSGTTVRDALPGISEPSWDLDHNGLLLRGDHSSIVRYSQAGGSPVTLRAPFYVERPRISPDGQSVLYECDYYRQYDDPLYLCRMDAAGQVTLYKTLANAQSWSPSGSLAYMRWLDWTTTTRRLVIEPLQAQPNPDGPGATEYPGFDDVTETVWSPDGQRLALVRNGELWIYSLPGMVNPVQIAHVPGTRISSVSWR